MTQILSRRLLRFENLDEAISDATTLSKAEDEGRLKQAGAWTLGQCLNHLACWVDYGFQGAPMKVPLLIRLVMRPMKSRMLSRPMRARVRIPGVKGGTLATDPVTTADALPHFVQSFTRLKDECPTYPSPLFGVMCHREWIALHLRHAELHLSFLVPGPSSPEASADRSI